MKLVICEKPSVAQTIAAVLNAKKRGDGFFEGGEGWIVSWCFGHLVELAAADAYGDQYKRWNRNVLPILPEQWKYSTTKDKAKQLSILRDLMKRSDVDTIVCATDAGREGQLIFQLVYDYCKCKKPVQRLWISSMEDSAICEGFDNLRPGSDYDNLYHSAHCRSKADWTVGINATRLFSCLYGTTLNVGRVQTPTLAMIVNRDVAVCGFISEPFYTPEIDCGSFTASGEKLKDAGAAEAIRTECDGRDAVCLSVEKQKKTAAPPKLYDLTTLQREANRLFGYTAQQTLDYTQSLYEKKLCTYPRTDSKYLTSGMEAGIPALVKVAADILPFAVKPDKSLNTSCVVKDAGVTDHHACIPTMQNAKTDLSSLPAGERNILQMLAVRLIAAVSPVHSFEAVTAVFECNSHRFTARGRTVLHDGWKAVEFAFRTALKNKPEEYSDEDDAALPEIKKGGIFQSVKASVKEGKTSPPRRYTEDTLLSAMETAGAENMPDDAERKGLGTPATRAATIEKLVKSGFVERQKKNIIATEKGINLIAVLPESIKSPLLTAQWEQKLKAVERGEFAESEFMDGIAVMTQKLVSEHSAPIKEYLALFTGASGKDDLTKREGIVGTCPRCGGGVEEKPKGFFCSKHSCEFALWKDNRFFAVKKKKITKTIATALLKEGRVFISDLYSERTGKTYGATIMLDDDGGRYVNFKLEFEGSKRK